LAVHYIIGRANGRRRGSASVKPSLGLELIWQIPQVATALDLSPNWKIQPLMAYHLDKSDSDAIPRGKG